MASISKLSVNKELNSQDSKKHTLKTQALENQVGEGTLLQESSLQKPFEKKRIQTILTSEQKTQRENFKKTLTWLKETFSDCFNLSNPKPLKRHIEADIFVQLPKDGSLSRKSIRNVLAFYVRRNGYLKALLENAHRFNLAGDPVEEVDSDHREYAKAALEMRTAKKLMRQAEKEKKVEDTRRHMEQA
jgi:hypothetical protein